VYSALRAKSESCGLEQLLCTAETRARAASIAFDTRGFEEETYSNFHAELVVKLSIQKIFCSRLVHFLVSARFEKQIPLINYRQVIVALNQRERLPDDGVQWGSWTPTGGVTSLALQLNCETY